MFTSPRGKLLRHSNFRRATWVPALAATGLAGIHFHDLRHAGNHLVAEAGANLRELMERMGHASSRAALIYLHSTDDRQRTLAEAVSQRARRDLAGESCGTSVARDGQTDDTRGAGRGARGPPEPAQIDGAPSRTRTCGLLLRRQSLYPPELSGPGLPEPPFRHVNAAREPH